MSKFPFYVLIVPIGLGITMATFLSSKEEQCSSSPSSITAEESALRDVIYGRGCCSRHGGQCGCRMDRVVCCDGTLSPSCGC